MTAGTDGVCATPHILRLARPARPGARGDAGLPAGVCPQHLLTGGFPIRGDMPTYQTGEAGFVWAQNAFVFRLIPNMRLVTTRPSEQRVAARRPARLLPGMGLPTGRFSGDLSAHRWRWPPGFADIGRDRNQHFPKLPRVCSQQMRGGGASSAVCCECKLRSSNNATPRSLCALPKNK